MNNLIRKSAIAVMCALFSFTVQAGEHYGLSEGQQQCYSRAMVGLDSVINSRIGVPIEEAMEITRKLGNHSISEQFDKSYLLAVLHAYMWNDSPHTYAIKVFSECTVEQTNSITQASAG